MSDSGSSSDLLNDLAHEFAERCRRGEHPALTEYTDKYPELADEIRDLFPALAVMEELGSAAGPPTGPYAGASQWDTRVPERMGEYRILREVARGGMGIVYEAVQESLGRHVALKVLPLQRLTHPTHLERFRREAKAVARLHHTNIVPVFGVGEHEGVHYYAMQFINGQGLDSVLKEVKKLRSDGNPGAVSDDPPEEILSASIARSLVHGFPGPVAEPACGASFQLAESPGKLKTYPTGVELASRTSSESASTARAHADHSNLGGAADVPYFRSVAQLGLQVAEALAHAHQQGVVHRDVKPSNLLLDTQGTVWITDFGLAKAEGTEDLTSPGDIVGTLRYMAPERFQGQCDSRSDVYSLGLTLYELLTLRPAFAASERAQLIDRLLHDRPARPRALDARIPRDLETIVLKAMAREPGERYPTATALAEDLRCFLTDRPIWARRTPLWERTWRLCKRNRLVASLTGLLVTFLLVATGVSIVAALYFDHLAQKEKRTAQQKAEERDKAEKARKEAVDNLNEAEAQRNRAEAQRKRAEASEAKARAVVREYLVKVTESQLLTVPGLQPLRRDLLTSALRFYEGYLKEHGKDSTLKAEIAATQLLVGRIYNDLGQGRECRRACQQAQLLYEALLQADPDNPEFQHGLGQCHYWGASDYAKAVEIWEKAVAARPAHAEYQRSLATAYNSLAIGERQKPAESLRLHQKALVIREKLVQNDPDSLENRNDLGATLNNIGVLLADKGQYQEALAMYRRAAGHEEVAYAKAPQMILYGRFLGTSYSNIANMSWRLGQRDEALEWQRKSVTVFRSLVGDNPAVPQLRSQLWGAYTGLARYQQERGKLSEAALSARLARDVIERLPRNTADDFYWLARVHALCAALVGEGKTELTAEEKAERKREADLAVKALQQSVAAGLKYVSWLKDRDDFEILHQRPDFKDLVSRMEEAVKADKLTQAAAKDKQDAKLKAQQEALAIRQKLAGADPENTQAQVDLAANLHAVGVLQGELGQTEEAAKALAQALAIRQSLNKKSPKDTRFQADLAATQVALGNLDWKAERYAEGARWWDKGLALFDAALSEEPQNKQLLTQLAYHERAVTEHYAEIGAWAEAANHSAKAFERQPSENGYDWFGHVYLPVILGDTATYERRCAELLKRFGNTNNEQLASDVSYACCLTPKGVTEPARLVQMAERVAITEKRPWRFRNLGLTLYRAARFEEAIQRLLEGQEESLSWPVLAMAHHRLGQKEKAREWLEKYEHWFQKNAGDALSQTSLKVPTFWTHWALGQVLHREAKELIQGTPAPENPTVRLLSGRAYAKLGERDKADAHFQAAVAVRPSDPEIWLARARVFLQLGQRDRAEADFAKILELKSDDPRLWIERGRYFAERGQHEKADAHFAKAAKLTPDELNRFLEAGWWVAGPYPRDLKIVCPPEIGPDPAKPVAAFSPFPALPVGSPVAGLSTLGGLAVPHFIWMPCKPEGHGLMIHRGHPALDKNLENVSIYAVTYVYSPDERQGTLHVGGDDHMRLWLNGRLVHETNKILGNEEALDRVSVMLKPGRNTLLVKVNNYQSGFYFRVRIADNPRDRGFAAAEVGLWDEAAKAFGKAIERQKEDANLHRLYAQLLLGSGDVDGYRRQCKRMLDQFGSTTEPNTAWALEAACSLSPTGITDPTRLVQFADIWLKAGQKESWRMFHVGMAHYRAGKFAEAVQYLESTAHTQLAQPVLAMAHHRLGHTEEARRWLAKTDEWYNRWIQDNLAATPLKFDVDSVLGPTLWREAKELIEGKPPPADPRLRLLRAKGFVQLGQFKKAEAEFQAAIDCRSKDADLWIARGRFYAERGEHKKADADFAKAATLTPQELNKFIEAGWWLVGPYPQDLKTPCPPEKNADPSKPVAGLGAAPAPLLPWRFVPTGAHGHVHLTVFDNAKNISAYALAYVFSPEERTTTLLVGGGNSLARVWLNGRLVHETTEPNGWAWGLYRVPVTLRAGRNLVLVKVNHLAVAHYFYLRIADGPLDRGLALAELGLWDEAAALWRKAPAREREGDVWVWTQYAVLLLASGDKTAYREHCTKMQERFRDWSWSGTPYNIARACALAPDGMKDAGQLVQMAAKGQEPSERWRIGVLGWAYYRAGKFEECIRRLTEIEDGFDPRNLLVLAMAHHRLGHTDEARKRLAKVEERYAQATREALKAPTFSPFLWAWPWHDCTEFVVLLREAKTLIEGTAPKEDANLAALQAKARQFLKRLDKNTAAYDWALAMQQDQPRLWLARGRRYAELKRWKEADADLAKAAELKPDDPQVWAERGRLYAEHGQPDKAAADFARALDLVPPPKFWWEDRSSFELDLGRRDDVIAQLARLRPTDKWVWIARLKHLAIVRDWKGAAQAAARWTGLEPDDAWGWYTLSILRWGAGDLPGYRQVCREMVTRFGEAKDAGVAHLTVKACLLLPDAVSDLKPVLRLAERAELPGWFATTSGMADYRAGNYTGALKRLRQAIVPVDDYPAREALNHLFLAMAHHQLGHADEATRALAQARAVEGRVKPQRAERPDLDEIEWLRVEIVRREAEALIRKQAPGVRK